MPLQKWKRFSVRPQSPAGAKTEQIFLQFLTFCGSIAVQPRKATKGGKGAGLTQRGYS